MLHELSELRTDAMELAAKLARVEFLRASGRPYGETTLPAALEEHRLATMGDGLAQACEELGNALEEDPPRPGRVARLSALRDFLARSRALALEPGAAQELLEIDRRRLVLPPGDAGLHGALPPVQVERDLPLVRERDKRADLERALERGLESAAGTRSALFETAQAALSELRLGEPGPAAIALQARSWGGEGPAEAAEKLLRATDAIAGDLGAWLLERNTGARPAPGGAERHDVLHLVHAPHCASAFPRGELVRTVRRWAEMLRLDPGAGGAVRLDEEEEPLRPGGACAIALDPPNEVRVLLWPAEGPRALAQLLFALSVAHLKAGPPGDAPPEDLWLSDRALPHACGALLASFARDPAWLRRCAKTDLGRDDERVIAYAFVLDARLAAARTLGSLEAHAQGFGARSAEAMREFYVRALGAELSPGLALRELDPWLSSWAELRGLALASRLRAYLRDRFDEDFWRNPRALASLQGLWGRGGRPTIAELWAELGGRPSVEPLAADLVEACR